MTLPLPPSLPLSRADAVSLLDRDLCVVAGAGSGKTTVLTERFVHLVLEGGVEMQRILTLTFTDRAAVEMRERVARALGERGRDDLRRDTASAWISTFHSFCARLLKENAIEAGVDPAFAVLTEGEASILLERTREEVVERILAEEPGRLDPLARLAGGTGGLEELVGILLDRCRGLDGGIGPVFAAASEVPDVGPGMALLRKALAALAAGAGEYTEAGARRAEAVAAAARGLDGPADDLPEAVAAVAKAVNLQVKGLAKENLAAVRAAAEPLLDDLVGVRAAPVARTLASLVAELDGAYADARDERGALDFHDLERRALGLLRDHPGVREEVRTRFDHLLVDEFQDTNPVQEALLSLLRTPDRLFVVGDPKQAIYGFRGADHGGFLRAREAAGERGTVLLRENFRSRPGILAFANAVLGPAFAGGLPVQVPWQDLVPGASFDIAPGPCVELHLVEGSRGESAGELRVVEAGLLADRLRALVEGGESAVTRRDREGNPLARPLAWSDAAILLRATTDVKIVERALADRDIPFQVVGGRGFYEAREVVDLANLLECVDNPRRELALAATLRSPFAGLDDDALLALAEERRRRKGSLGDLLLCDGPVRVDGLAPEGRRRAEAFRAVFRELRDLRSRGRLVELVERALEGTGFALASLLRPDGRQAAANLRKVREQARAFEADGAGGLGEFSAAVRRLRLREVRETEAPLASEDAVSILTVHQAKGLEWPLVVLPDAGRAVPPVADPVLLEGGRASLSLQGPDGPLRTRLWKADAEVRKAREAAESMRVLHVAMTRAREHLLVSSVRSRKGVGPWWRAVTVAVSEERFPEEPGTETVELPVEIPVPLLLGRHAPAAAAGRRRAVSLLEKHRRRLLAGKGVRTRLPKGERAAVAAAAASVPPPAPPCDGTPYLVTVSSLLDFEEDPERWWRRHVIGVPDRTPPLPAERAAPSTDLARGGALERTEGAAADVAPPLPSRRDARPGDDDEVHDGVGGVGAHGVPRWISGVAAHAVLGNLDFAADGEARVREQARARLREEMEEPPPEAAVEEVVGWVQRFRASPAGRDVAAAALRGELHRELPFLRKWRAGGSGLLVRGQADLVYRDGGGRWVVGDYKASAEPTRRGKARRYARQIALYTRALADLFPGARGVLLYLDGPAPAAVEVDPPPPHPPHARFLAAVPGGGTTR